ncbi:MAG TPA: hypothetical protein VK166_14455 [Chitinophagaceae bacterium]|nr:hypothetical protein [Chitinophagaceae bacterium]
MTPARILIFASAIMILSCNQTQQQDSAPVLTDTAKASQQPVADTAKLVGTWTRTDSPYEIRILELKPDGSMLAGYFNPQSINVGRANWINTNGVLQVYVELRDENYPGSTYTLIYQPDQDMLTGKYFQAVEGVTYDIAFMRKK